MTEDSGDQRLMQLEMLFTHLQQSVQQLNEEVVAQSKRIAALDRKLSSLIERLITASEQEDFLPPGNEPPPPHY